GGCVGLLNRLTKRNEEPRLARLLKTYPAYEAPFRGPPRGWSLEQAKANLLYLEMHKDVRIEVLRRTLAEYDIVVPADLGADDPQPLLDALNGWAARQWPNARPPELTDTDGWLASSRSGPDIIFSLLMDVAILFGDMVIARRPPYAWSLDLEPES